MTDRANAFSRRAFAGSALLVGALAAAHAPDRYRWDIRLMDAS